MYGRMVTLTLENDFHEQVTCEVWVSGCPGDPESVWQARALDKLHRLLKTGKATASTF